MISNKINAYLDSELTMRLESFVINALPKLSKQSDFNMIYLANIEIKEENGIRTQTSVYSDDTIFLSISNDFGEIDFDLIKTIHVPGVLTSDFEEMSYTPTSADMHLFANYYEGKEVPVGGGYLQVAICPFGINTIEFLNGDTVQIFGTGKVPISREQRGFKRYANIPKVDKILSNDYFKILKLAIYTRYNQYAHRKYSLNIFSPTMRVEEEEIRDQFLITDPLIKLYIQNDIVVQNDGSMFLRNLKDNTLVQAKVSKGDVSNLYGLGNMVKVDPDGYIDTSPIGQDLGDEFSIHTNVLLTEYAHRGTTIFEFAYGITDSGFQTHHITLWADKDGILRYNTQHSDEHESTGYKLKLDMEHAITFTIENQKFDEQDDDEYTVFIHVDGKQIWPKKPMLTPTEKIYLWRAKEAYRTFTEVCMLLPAPHPISGGVDAKGICAKKLLHESGFITLENLKAVYQLYLNRPRASRADPNTIKLNSEDHTMIEKMFFGQDSEKDTFDSEYYLKGQFSEIIAFSPSLNREQIELIHLLNTIRSTSVKL